MWCSLCAGSSPGSVEGCSDLMGSLTSDPCLTPPPSLSPQQGAVSQVFQLNILKEPSACPTPSLERKERRGCRPSRGQLCGLPTSHPH